MALINVNSSKIERARHCERDVNCSRRAAVVPSLHCRRPVRQQRCSRIRAAIGIDLGTTNSLVAAIVNGKPTILPDDEGNALLPSVVRYCEKGVIVGSKAQQGDDPLNTFFCVKRIIGRRGELVDGIARDLPYKLVCDADGFAALDSPAAGQVTPVQVSSEILKVLKLRAEQHTKEPVDRAVITVPAHFDNDQRLATMSAAMLAGIERVSLLQEPVAAAMAYGLGKPQDEQPAILVFDLGGGTFDVSLLQSFEGIMEVVGSDGDNQLGGFDMDTALLRFVLNKALSKDEREQVWASADCLQRARDAAEQAKIMLSESESAQFKPHLKGVPEVALEISRGDLAAASEPFLGQLWEALNRLGSTYKLAYSSRFDGSPDEQPTAVDRFAPPPRAVSQLVLVGGATKSPLISSFAERIVGCAACQGADPEQCVAFGAAIQAGLMDGSLSGGLEMMDSVYVADLQGRVSGFQM